jgi:two-component system response regulator HydG
MARILLVEDEVDVRLITEHVLFDAGHKVDTTGTMTGASELIRSRSYDLVIADGKLPDGTGMEVADIAGEKDIKALVITGYAFTLPGGALDRYEILLKPLRPRIARRR